MRANSQLSPFKVATLTEVQATLLRMVSIGPTEILSRRVSSTKDMTTSVTGHAKASSYTTLPPGVTDALMVPGSPMECVSESTLQASINAPRLGAREGRYFCRLYGLDWRRIDHGVGRIIAFVGYNLNRTNITRSLWLDLAAKLDVFGAWVLTMSRLGVFEVCCLCWRPLFVADSDL